MRGRRWRDIVAGRLQEFRRAHKLSASRGRRRRIVLRQEEICAESSCGLGSPGCGDGCVGRVGLGYRVSYSGSIGTLAAWLFRVPVSLSWLRDLRG